MANGQHRKETNDLKKTEEMLRLKDRAINASTQGICIIDPNQSDHPIIYVNNGFEKLTGYTKAEVLGRNMRFLRGPETSQTTLYSIKKAVGEGREFSAEVLNYRKDDTTFWNRISITPVRDDFDQLTHFISVHTDVTARKHFEGELQRVNDELDQRVKKRTTELVNANEQLKNEIRERKMISQALRKSEKELKAKAVDLEEVNTALRVLLKKRDEDKLVLEENFLFNVKELVFPFLENLKKSRLDTRQKTYLDIMESNLNGLMLPFARNLCVPNLALTPTELQVANFVVQGKTTKEISAILNLAIKTIESHRKRIRKKIGIRNKKVNLRTGLLTILNE